MTREEIIKMAKQAGFVTNEIKSYVISPYTSEDQDLYQELEAFAKLLAKRTWVGLTYKEKHEIRYSHMTSEEFIDFIEAKLKDKNTSGQE